MRREFFEFIFWASLPNSQKIPIASLLFVEFLDESALVQLGNEASVHKLFGLVAADVGIPGGDDFINHVQVFCDRIRRGNEILPISIVSAFQILRIFGSQVFAQNLLAELLVLL